MPVVSLKIKLNVTVLAPLAVVLVGEAKKLERVATAACGVKVTVTVGLFKARLLGVSKEIVLTSALVDRRVPVV